VDRAFGTAERHSWEADRNWQPIRRAVELALVEGQAMIEAGTALLAVPGARTADEMAAEVRSEWAALLEPVGL